MSGNTRFQCKLCEFACSEIAEIIDHMIFSHPSNELSFRKCMETGSADSSIWQTKNFCVVPSVIKDNRVLIYSEPSTENILEVQGSSVADSTEFFTGLSLGKTLQSLA